MRFESLSNLEEDLDHLLKIGGEGATACQGVPIFNNYSYSDEDHKSFSGSHLGLIITTMPQGRFVYWKVMEASKLLEYDSRLVAFMQELPFQEGKPLCRITKEEEGSTELVKYNHMAETSPDRQVYMASLRNTQDDEPGPAYDAELLADISVDERTADAPQVENEELIRIRQLKNAKRAKCRRNTENRTLNPLYHRNLNNAFAAAIAESPLCIVAASGVPHVQAAVRCGRAHGVRLRVRSGGHDYEGLSYRSVRPEVFAVLDLSRLRAVDVRPAEAAAWVDAGATLGELYHANVVGGDGVTTYESGRVWGEKYFMGNFRRLAAVKGRVDPADYFRNEQSIPPLLQRF
ncbi:inactive tetrahydrocannabinolic acid synthase-like [Panicum miliaceum]|uniref:Inactive tetrahydrocannabinolic acid synthase-like n=1 Tax=Panicum miliaceum TaxID=4540 RepID=A0A3L6PJP5_PANMI|nr:inactive tetrahydrocannabinolic acid synthase-like [Panicum miliaceum]